jgi:homoserine dehydrogenase
VDSRRFFILYKFYSGFRDGGQTEMSDNNPKFTEVAVALVGMGNVGGGVLKQLKEILETKIRGSELSVQLTHVLDGWELSPEKKALVRSLFPNALIKCADANDKQVIEELTNDHKFHIIIECTGATKLQALYRHCLDRGIPVITPNKAFLVQNLDLVDEFAQKGTPLMFEASVGGGMPVIKFLRDNFSGDRISFISGIFNGTSNYILTRMMQGSPLDQALEKARDRGLAEPKSDAWRIENDPDLNGRDIYYKLAILAYLVWGVKCKSDAGAHESQGIGMYNVRRCDQRYAKEKLDSIIRFVGVIQQPPGENDKNKLNLFFSPVMLPLNHDLASIEAENNAMLIGSDFTGSTLCVGPGAGPSPTANAILSDMLVLYRELKEHPSAQRFSVGMRCVQPTSAFSIRPFAKLEFPAYYIRFVAKDEPGIIGKITSTLGSESLNIREVLQLNHSMDETGEVVAASIAKDQHWKYIVFAMTVERAQVSKVSEALEKIERSIELASKPVLIPFLEIPTVNGWQKREEVDNLIKLSAKTTKRFNGQKYSIDLFPGRYLPIKDGGEQDIAEILESERASRKGRKATVQRLFVLGKKADRNKMQTIIRTQMDAGVSVKYIEAKDNLDILCRYLQREDGFLEDITIYDGEDLAIVELANLNEGEIQSAGTGFQIYGKKYLESYLRTYKKLWEAGTEGEKYLP